jgi:glycerophosphoryl diester phosphodiesterase
MLTEFDDPVRRIPSAGNRRALARLRRRVRRQREHGVSVRHDLLTPAVVQELKEHTDVVMVWPVDSPEALARVRSLGVDAVISKNLDLLREVVAEAG